MLKSEQIRALRQNGFPPEMVLASFDSTTLQHGVYFYENDRVLDLESHFPSLSRVELEAVVLDGDNCHTQVVVDLNRYRIRSQCSCAVPQCKHALAVLLAYTGGKRSGSNSSTQSANKESPSLVQKWLDSLSPAAPVIEPESAEDDPAQSNASRMELLYLLSQSSKNSNRLSVEPRKAVPLKKGGYGQLYRVQLDDLLHKWQAPSFMCEALDYDLAHLILPHRHNNYHTPDGKAFTLEGHLGQITLGLLLQTGRVFWQTTDRPALKQGASRALRFSWEQEPEGKRIHADVQPGIQDYFWLDKLYYIDYQSGECGGLEQESGLTVQQAVKLLAAPIIPSSNARHVSQKLLEILPVDSEIPLPEPALMPVVKDIRVEQVKVLLKLKPDPYGNTKNSPWDYIASLAFEYQGHVIQPKHDKPQITLRPKSNANKEQPEERLRIHRQLEQEQAALEHLYNYGFDAYPQNPAHPLQLKLKAENPVLAALQWNNFTEHLPALQEKGWLIEHELDNNLEFTLVEDWEAEVQNQDSDWFTLSMGFEVNGQRINLLPVLVDMLSQLEDPRDLHQLLSQQSHLLAPLEDGRWIKLDAERVIKVLDALIELYDSRPLNKEGQLLLSRFQGNQLNELLNDPQLNWSGAQHLRELNQKLQNFQGIQTIEPPESLQADLRPYQQNGLNWLGFLGEFQFNGILADDMGLGKTLQALAHILLEKEKGDTAHPNLVIAPTSLMSNWRREVEKFAPKLSVLTLHGHKRKQDFAHLKDYDLILTTYPLILRDEEVYRDQQFHYLILDEAQTIKNARSKTTQAIYALQAQHRICLTGTPVENHLGELWSMFHFLMPGFLGSYERFNRLFRTPIEKQQDQTRQVLLQKRLQPFMLRRTKDVVASELPPKTEIIRMVNLEGEQRDLYESVRLAMDSKIQQEIRTRGFARSRIMILDALLKLRQTCCDPRLLKLEHAKDVTSSAKLELLMSMLTEMLEEGRKVLLFSQFTSMLSIIEQEFQQKGFRYSLLTGQTREREKAIQAFQEGDAQVFLISLKAGGTGLNLTAADTVIHYDPWWNPAVEQQATDRAYRIGQDKPVFVYKLLAENTVEEKILKLQERKQSLADGLYADKESQNLDFSQDDLAELLQPLDL